MSLRQGRRLFRASDALLFVLITNGRDLSSPPTLLSLADTIGDHGCAGLQSRRYDYVYLSIRLWVVFVLDVCVWFLLQLKLSVETSTWTKWSTRTMHDFENVCPACFFFLRGDYWLCKVSATLYHWTWPTEWVHVIAASHFLHMHTA